MTKKLLFAILILAGMFALSGCGGSSSNDNPNPTTDGDEDTAKVGNFKATVIDFPGRKALPGITVSVIDNQTGEPVAGVDPVTSDDLGQVSFTNIPLDAEGKAAFLCAAADFIDTYQFNLDGNAQDEEVWIVPETVYLTAPAAAGLVLEAGKALTAGGVYWVNGDGEEEIVGCATVATDPEGGEVRYMSDQTLPTTPQFRDSINPLNGFFVIGNVAPGVTYMKIFKGDEGKAELGKTRIVAKPDSVTIGNVYATYEGAPGTALTANPKTCDPK